MTRAPAKDRASGATAPTGRPPRTDHARAVSIGLTPWRPLLVVAAAAALAAASFAVVPAQVGFDPWNWLIWGRQIVDGHLDTRGGTSWKPLPVLLTTPLSLAGGAAPVLWLGVERTAALLGFLGVLRLGLRLGGPVAGVLAVGLAAPLGYALLWFAGGTSELPLVGLVAWAVVAQLDGRPVRALALWYAAALLQPTAWPFVAAQAALVAVRRPERRVLALGLLAALPVVWLGPEWLGSGSLTGGSDKALGSPAAAELREAAHPWRLVLHRWGVLLPVWLGLLAVAAVVLALLRRRRAEPLLGLVVVGWVGLVAAMAEVGFASTPRFLLPAAVLAVALAATAVAALAQAVARRLPAPRLAQAIVVVLALLPLAPWAGGRLDRLRHDRTRVAYAAAHQAQLGPAVEQAGGRERLLACGSAFTYRYRVPHVTWALDPPARPRRAPGVVLVRARTSARGTLVPALEDATAGVPRVARSPTWEIRARCRAGLPPRTLAEWRRVGAPLPGARAGRGSTSAPPGGRSAAARRGPAAP